LRFEKIHPCILDCQNVGGRVLFEAHQNARGVAADRINQLGQVAEGEDAKKTEPVASTLFGLATSLGLGVQQVNAGLNFLFGLQITTPVQVGLIAIITGFATASVVSGLGNGVRRLSELNMILAAVLMGFVLLVGPTLFIMNSFVENLGYYAASLPTFSFWTESFSGTEWQNGWTVFYLGWWVSWSPFVGIFIARVSKGRTVREFIGGVLLLPSMLTFLWMSTFGGTALSLELGGSSGVISEAVSENVATALFVMLEQLPLTGITSFVGIVLVVVFFVTSSDSGETLDEYKAGVRVVEVQLQKADAPDQGGVVDAFRDVEDAGQEAETIINQAIASQNNIVPEARGEAAQILQDAQAYRDRVIAEAEGEAERFNQIYEEYAKAPVVTRQRMYLETIEDVYGRGDKIILDDEAGSGVVPYLPLDQLSNRNNAPRTGGQ
ncbi:MAG: BCCT family transporter, partial [Pseudomonadota bacterium]